MNQRRLLWQRLAVRADDSRRRRYVPVAQAMLSVLEARAVNNGDVAPDEIEAIRLRCIAIALAKRVLERLWSTFLILDTRKIIAGSRLFCENFRALL
jgi:hypothetical protein